ncbi:MAG: 30S ribosomal protein S12 methylthiotransferase RimO [Treponema sp.]|nr:30S ribosomal protein S12 methylthiotransferase RimO [Treponema sp.]
MDNHGCAKNQTDGELLLAFLSQKGYELTLDADQADFIIINTCGFIESAKKESIEAVYSVKAAYPDAKIILTGCLAQRYAQDLYEGMPELDGVFGNGDLSKICEFMQQVEENKRAVKTYEQKGICETNRPILFNFKASAFVKVTEGCSNHCSFCAIPLIRGELRSRKIENVISEIKALLKAGIYEINLIGQDLAAYGSGLEDADIQAKAKENNTSALALLLSEISKLEGDFLIRLLYIHPDHFNEDILDVMEKDARFARYFDIPFQSGDDEIIKKMNRTGSASQYTKLVQTIRARLPETMIRTTFLTGFPGESDSAAKNTLEFLRSIKADWSGCFPYSREEDTPAYKMTARVPKKIAQKRAEILEEAQAEFTANRLASFVGQSFDVLVEEIIENDAQVSEDAMEGLAIGRAWFQAPEVDGCIVIRYDLDSQEDIEAVKSGNLVKVQILAVTGVDLDGRFIQLRKKFEEYDKIKFVR